MIWEKNKFGGDLIVMLMQVIAIGVFYSILSSVYERTYWTTSRISLKDKNEEVKREM